MSHITFNVTDVSNLKKLETLLLQITKQIEAIKSEYGTRIGRIGTELDRVSKEFGSARSSISRIEGVYATMNRMAPANVMVYDEATRQWINPGGTTLSLTGDIIPTIDDTYNIGSATKEWKNLYIDGIATIDSLIADTADINAGTIDNTAIGASTPAAGNFSTVNIDGGTIDGTAIGNSATGACKVAAFGCNAAAVQTSYASGGALAGYVTGAFGLDSDAHMTALYDLVVKIRAALVANGIMS